MPNKALRILRMQKKRILKAFMLAALLYAAFVTSVPAAQTVFMTAETGKRKLPIYCVDTPDKKVAVSFDAAWGADDTEKLLEILRNHDVKATFFLCGYWVDKYPNEVKRIHEEGHDIANHGNTHAHGAQISKEENIKEIKGVHDKVKQLLGIEMNLFRPPYGEYNNNVIEAATESGYYTIQWDIEELVTNLQL